MLGWLALTIALGGVFLVGQGLEYWKLFQTGVDVSTNLFATTFFTLTGFHGLHVLFGLVALLIFLWLAWQGDFALGLESAFAAAGYDVGLDAHLSGPSNLVDWPVRKEPLSRL